MLCMGAAAWIGFYAWLSAEYGERAGPKWIDPPVPGWPYLVIALAVVFLLMYWLSFRFIGRYVANRCQMRLGLPTTRRSLPVLHVARLAWGRGGENGKRIVGVLDALAGRVSTSTPESTADAIQVADSVKRQARKDMVWALLAGLAVAPIMILMQQVRPFWLGLGLLDIYLVAFIVLGPVLLGPRQYDPWLAWYKRHFLD